jgi:hypothetical protein
MLRLPALAGMTMLVALSAPAHAFEITDNDLGGLVEPYVLRLAAAEARGEPVRIGAVQCNSSCTLFLAARRACVSSQAVFGFHAPWIGLPSGGTVDPKMVSMFSRAYKPALRRLFLAHVDRTKDIVPGPLMKLSGLQLASLGYRLCDDAGAPQIAADRSRSQIAHSRAGKINPSAQASSFEFSLARWLGFR